MQARFDRRVTITVTPSELRELADRMEKELPKAGTPGKPCVVQVWRGDDFEVCLAAEVTGFFGELFG